MSSLHFYLYVSYEFIAIFTCIFQMRSLHFFMYISRAVPWIAPACERRSWVGVGCVSSYRGTPRAGRRRWTPRSWIRRLYYVLSTSNACHKMATLRDLQVNTHTHIFFYFSKHFYFCCLLVKFKKLTSLYYIVS